jgi:hypothetical protein
MEKRTEKTFDAVNMMRTIRARLNEVLCQKGFDEESRYLREHVSLPKPRHVPRNGANRN